MIPKTNIHSYVSCIIWIFALLRTVFWVQGSGTASNTSIASTKLNLMHAKSFYLICLRARCSYLRTNRRRNLIPCYSFLTIHVAFCWQMLHNHIYLVITWRRKLRKGTQKSLAYMSCFLFGTLCKCIYRKKVSFKSKDLNKISININSIIPKC